MEFLIVLVLLALVALWVSIPLRREEGFAEPAVEDPVLAELEARKQAKYREIRDTEQDHAQRKLSDEEFAPPGRGAARGGDRDPQADRRG